MPTALQPSENPKYLEIAEHLRRDIRSGILRPGDRLPTFVELRERFSISPSTVERAHAMLEREGLIVRGQGRRGTQVAALPAPAKRNVIGCSGIDFRLAATYPYWGHLLAGMQDTAEANGFELLLMGQAPFASWEKIDGVVLHGACAAKYVQELPYGMPAVSMMGQVEGVPSVVTDDFEGTRRATQHLLQLGHRRIGTFMLVEMPLPHRRLEGYRAALHEVGIVPDTKWVWPFKTVHTVGSLRDNARLHMATWLSGDWKHSGVTAILAQNDEVAIGIMDAVFEAGLRVPEDVSVIGFDGTEECERTTPLLTSIAVPLDKIGATAMEILLRQIREGRMDDNVITLPARLSVRGSTAKVEE